MAPSREACAVAVAMAAPFLATMASNIGSASVNATGGSGNGDIKRRRTSSDALQRTVSDVSYELHHQHGGVNKQEKKAAEAEQQQQHQPPPPLHPVPEVQDAKCECCGMSEECTPEYIRGVRGRFAGRWVCGLCAEAVTEEVENKKGGGTTRTLEEALKAHMGVCKRFNGFGRTHPVLFQAEAMREILRRRAKLGPRSRSSINPREVREVATKARSGGGGTGIARSSSCMLLITDDFNDRASVTGHRTSTQGNDISEDPDRIGEAGGPGPEGADMSEAEEPEHGGNIQKGVRNRRPNPFFYGPDWA